MAISQVSTTHQTKQSYCMSLCLSNLFYLLNVYSQHSDIIPVSFHIAFSSKIVLLVSIFLRFLFGISTAISLDNGPH